MWHSNPRPALYVRETPMQVSSLALSVGLRYELAYQGLGNRDDPWRGTPRLWVLQDREGPALALTEPERCG